MVHPRDATQRTQCCLAIETAQLGLRIEAVFGAYNRESQVGRRDSPSPARLSRGTATSATVPVMAPESVAASLVEKHLSRKVLDATQVTNRGTVNTVVVVRTLEARVVVRIAEAGRDEFHKEGWAMRAARAVGVFCPEVLAVGWTGDGEERRAFSVQTYVGDRDAVEADDVWPEVGRMLRLLHGVAVRGWGLDMEAPGAFDSRWDDYLGRNVASLNDADPLRERGLLDADESEQLRSLFEDMATRRWKLGLCHGDVALRNLRTCQEGRVALVDWGCARADVVPGEELARFAREHDPRGDAFAGLLRGYGAAWSSLADDVRAVSLLSCVDLSRWCLDRCPERIGYYGRLLRWGIDVHMHGVPWRRAPDG